MVSILTFLLPVFNFLVCMKYLLLLTLMLTSGMLIAQNPSCCSQAEGKKECENKAVMAFANFAEEEDFQNMHPDPKPISFKEKGAMITFPTRDDQEASAYMVNGADESKQYLFVIHEWWGLNDHIKAEADRLHKELGGEIHVIALDLYNGEVATTRQKASELMQNVDPVVARAVIGGAMDMVGQEAEVATIGWCFGGGWSMQTALELGNQAVGCVIYYGMPEQDVDRLANLETDVLGIFASKDEWINEEVVQTFKMNMESAGKNLTYEVFDAHHAFANPSRDVFDEESAKVANQMAVGFLLKSYGIE